MRSQLSICLAALFLSTSVVSAESVHLTLFGGKGYTERIYGDSTVTSLGREGTIECGAYSHMVAAVPDEKSGMAGLVHNHYPISILKRLDRSTPRLYTAWRNHEPLRAEFRFYRPDPSGDGSIEQHYTVIIDYAFISGIRQFVPNVFESGVLHQAPSERISFTYGRINEIWVPTGLETIDEWTTTPSNVPLSDVNFDGIVNMKDYAILADDWMTQY
ncbi:MAG: hypothetical protein A2Y07_08940 [Planctomycetes bacterium GWF2_50_10]|nr:MAG: hypothetical protein A2Y07_08940 [Planctomycetes bacterium GWF2_50_10]